MGVIDKLNSRISTLNDPKDLRMMVCQKAFSDLEDSMLEAIKAKLAEGRKNDNTFIHPSYEEDLQPNGFFKTRETAQAYQRMKLYRFGIPIVSGGINLKMTGELVDNMYVDIQYDSAEVTSSYVGRSLNAAATLRGYNQNNQYKITKPNVFWFREQMYPYIKKLLKERLK